MGIQLKVCACIMVLAQKAPCYKLLTCTSIATDTRMQVCFWVACLPLQSFLRSFWFRQRCSLWVEIQMLMHLKQALTAVKWNTINRGKKTFLKEKRKICPQKYFSTELDLFLFKVNHSDKMFLYLTVKRHKVFCYIKAKLTHSVPMLQKI